MRSIQLSDIDVLEELEYACFPDDNMGGYALERELEVGGGYIVETSLGRGYVLYRDTSMRDILRLGLEEAARGRGLGELLLLTALIGVRDALLTVKKTNQPAFRLYRKHGFVIVGEDRPYNNWMMRRHIRRAPNFDLHPSQT